MLDVEFDKATSVHPTIAVQFQQGFVRLIQFETRSQNTFELRSFAEVPLSDGIVQNNVITNPEAAAEAISKGLESARPKSVNTNYAICLLPPETTFFFTIDLPGTLKSELKAILTRQIGSILPMPVTEVYWDWHRIGIENNKTHIQLAAVDRKVVDSYIETLSKAKLTPLLVEPETIAAARLVSSVDAQYAKSSILVQLYKQTATLSLLNDHDVVFSSEIGTANLSPKEISKSISRKVTEILRYAHVKSDKEQETPLLIFGSTGIIEELLPALEEQGIKNASRINYKIENKELEESMKPEHKDEYIPLMGAAIRGLGKATSIGTTLNLVPQQVKDKFQLTQLSKMMRSYLTFVAINVVLLVMLVALVSINMDRRVRDLTERYQAIINFSESQKANSIENSINTLNTNSSDLKKLIGSIYDWDKLFNLFESSTPNGIVLHNLAVEPTVQSVSSGQMSVSISGVANNRSLVLDMIQTLRQSKLLTDIKLPLESLQVNKNVSFIIEARLIIKQLLDEQ